MSRFATTNWSLILRAAGGDDAEAELAMALLCEAYWYPVYAFVRRQGHSAADAEDLTQGYFARFLEKGFIREVRPEHGRFRAFLLVSVRNFLHNERDRVRALKRGGGRRLVSLDAVTAERTYEPRMADRTTPEDLFERSWAQTVFDRVLDQLEQRAEPAGPRDADGPPAPVPDRRGDRRRVRRGRSRVGRGRIGGSRGRAQATQGLRRAPPRGRGRADRDGRAEVGRCGTS